MKIVSWNCNGSFRNKYQYIKRQDADIYVIQECENPERYKDAFPDFADNYFWTGENGNRGLAIFPKPSVELRKNDWPVYCLRNFLSVKVNNSIDLIGVWTGKPYIEEYYTYQSIHFEQYGDNTAIIGDFNSNTIWDKEHGNRNHSAVVEQLK